MSAQPTPRPWKLGRLSKKGFYRYIEAPTWGEFARVVVRMEGDYGPEIPEGTANAELIVRAVNLHERLVEALKDARAALWIVTEDHLSTAASIALDRVDAVLAEVEGKEAKR